jgi:SulP family sulfate permease
MLVALPSSIAFGIAVFGLLGPEYVAHGVSAGIIGAVVLGLVAPALGSSSLLISAPCAPSAAVLAAFASELLASSRGVVQAPGPARIMALLMLVALLSGALQLAYGTLGAGKVIKYIPYPVVSGFNCGVAVSIFASQVPKCLGLAGAHASWGGVLSPSLWDVGALLIGAATIAGTVAGRRATRVVPPAIVGLLSGGAVYGVLALFEAPLRRLDGNALVIGRANFGGGMAETIAANWSGLRALQWGDLALVTLPALTLSVILSIDTLKTCVALDTLSRSRHSSNRELVGQGLGNTLSSLLGGMPGAGATGPTMVNKESGATTRLSGVFEGAFVLAAFLVLGRWIAWVPIPALAGLLVIVAVRMFDWGSFELLRQRSTLLDFSVIAAVVIIAVRVNLITAAGAGFGLAIMLFFREQIQGSVIRFKVAGDKLSSKQHRRPAEQAVLERCGWQTTVCELQGSLFFGTTDQLLTELEWDLKRCRYLVLDWRHVRSVDFTAAHMLELFEAILKERGGYVVFSRLPRVLSTGQDLRRYFEQVGVMRENVRLFDSLDDALQWVEDRILAEELPWTGDAEAPLALSEFDMTRQLSAPGELAILEPCVHQLSLESGQHVFRAGDRADEIYLIRSGVVRIVLPLAGGGHHNLASCGRGSFFGEVAFLDGGSRSADALTTTTTELFVIPRARFDEMAAAHPEVATKLLAELARALSLRLRHTDAEIRAFYES